MEPPDPALTAILNQIANGTLGAAGARLWHELTALFGRGRLDEEGTDLPADPPQPEAVPQVADALTAIANTDPRLSEALVGWLAKAKGATIQGDVDNTVGGDVSGTVIQLGHIARER